MNGYVGPMQMWWLLGELQTGVEWDVFHSHLAMGLVPGRSVGKVSTVVRRMRGLKMAIRGKAYVPGRLLTS